MGDNQFRAALGELSRPDAPRLISIGEWVDDACRLHGRQGLLAGAFNAHIQALTVACPAGAARGHDSRFPGQARRWEVAGGLTCRDHVYGRVQVNRCTASTTESLEIVGAGGETRLVPLRYPAGSGGGGARRARSGSRCRIPGKVPGGGLPALNARLLPGASGVVQPVYWQAGPTRNASRAPMRFRARWPKLSTVCG